IASRISATSTARIRCLPLAPSPSWEEGTGSREGLRILPRTRGDYRAAGSHSLVLLLADTQHYGVFVAQIFFGLWLAPMGYLAYKSGWFPKALGILLILACVSYLVDLLAAFLVPDLGTGIHGVAWILPAIAEIWMVGYLL